MKNKETAVEFIDAILLRAIKNFNGPNYTIARNTLINFRNVVIDDAKAIEKNQIIEAYNESFLLRNKPYATAEKYYNETYKNK